MRQLIFLLLLPIFFYLGCEKSNEDKIVAEDLEQLSAADTAWLDDLKSSFTNCSCRMSIMHGVYQGKTVFYSLMNDPLCNSAFNVVLLDIHGNPVKEYLYGEQQQFFEEVYLVKVIYTCKD